MNIQIEEYKIYKSMMEDDLQEIYKKQRKYFEECKLLIPNEI